MRFTAILDHRLWGTASSSAGYFDRLLALVLRDAVNPPPAGTGFAAAMSSFAPQDPLLIAEWLRAEDALGRPPAAAAESPSLASGVAP